MSKKYLVELTLDELCMLRVITEGYIEEKKDLSPDLWAELKGKAEKALKALNEQKLI